MGIENTILFGKYQLGPVIGQGRSGTVFLALHIELEEQRAIKRVAKDFVGYEQFKREALLLKELHHPGIPIVYDLEEDMHYSYLIEEYLEGDSVYDLVKNHGPLSQEAVIRYGIQICSLVHYLHSAGETPILYLDLQPKNLLLCHETVKLVDFDHAAPLENANEAETRFGTPGCCAPEQMDTDMSLDTRTDVFAIGGILHFMSTGDYPGEGINEILLSGRKKLGKVIATCLLPRKEARYQSAECLRQTLEEIRRESVVCGPVSQKRMDVFKNNRISSLTIAVAGSSPGVGTTHLSLSLSAYLKQTGSPNVYEEHNRSGAVRRMMEYQGSRPDGYGIFCFQRLLLKPWYGEAVRLKNHNYAVVIRDYGTDWELLKYHRDADAVLLVCGGAWWNVKAGESAVQALESGTEPVVIYNHPIPGVCARAPGGISRARCFRMPYFENPCRMKREVSDCWQEVLYAAVSKKRGVNPIRSFLRKLTGIIRRKTGLSE